MIDDQRGQSFALALIALAVGSLLIVPFLNSVSTQVLASRKLSELLVEQYAADAALEDGIWSVVHGDLGPPALGAPGSTTGYSLGEAVNGITSSGSITRDRADLSGDGFESGDWSGGTGWRGDWVSSSNVGDNGDPQGIATDGSTVLVVDNQDQEAYTYDTSGAFLESFDLVAANGDPKGIATDGTSVWVLDRADGEVYRYDMSGAFHDSLSLIGDNADGEGITYVPPETVLSGPDTVASDDFESGDLDGGSGWVSSWQTSGTVDIKSNGSPHAGSWHMRLRKGDGTAYRDLDLAE